MMELGQILILHASRYPKMEPTDGVKLIYQNEFGGGHLVRDEEMARNFLRREFDEVQKDPSGKLYEEIGNGILRVNLAALEAENLDTLFSAFVSSARVHRGNLVSFRDKLDVLRCLTAKGVFAFDIGTLEAYLADYEAAGFPMVSHSLSYRNAYRPAYRIIREEYRF